MIMNGNPLIFLRRFYRKVPSSLRWKSLCVGLMRSINSTLWSFYFCYSTDYGFIIQESVTFVAVFDIRTVKEHCETKRFWYENRIVDSSMLLEQTFFFFESRGITDIRTQLQTVCSDLVP